MQVNDNCSLIMRSGGTGSLLVSLGQSPGGIKGAKAPEALKSARGPKDHTHGSNSLRISLITE